MTKSICLNELVGITDSHARGPAAAVRYPIRTLCGGRDLLPQVRDVYCGEQNPPGIDARRELSSQTMSPHDASVY
jgi:hypothetical protein